jgi:maltose phosphorylase
MSKVAQPYLDVDPWVVRERGFHPDRSKTSESIFSLANEFMGVRGYFEEGFGGERMVGSFFNGVFEDEDLSQMPVFSFRGMIARSHGIANAVDWLHTRISVGSETLDLATSTFDGFERVVDLQTGVMTRSFVWHPKGGAVLKVHFARFLSIDDGSLGFQRIAVQALTGACELRVRLGLDFEMPQYTQRMARQWECLRRIADDAGCAILGRVKRSGHCVLSSARFEGLDGARVEPIEEGAGYVGVEAIFTLNEGESRRIDRSVVNRVRRDPPVDVDAMWSEGRGLAKKSLKSFDTAFADHAARWQAIWENLDIEIDGDLNNQQGIRYCLFQLYQSYRGVDPTLNVTAKGLTSECYNGWTWWDTETYCLPFYLFNNPLAARRLLQYRHITLPGALERARQMGDEGARYPMGTIDGTEAVAVWQHGDLEIHVSAAVAFGIEHYTRVTGDFGFMREYGLEILLQVCRFYASRGQWSPKTGEFGFWCTMGADEFHMMVHNNFYTNFMVKQAFEYTLATMERMRREAAEDYRRMVKTAALRDNEPDAWREMAAKIRLNRDPATGLIEQHDGYFDMPHLDLAAVPPEQFPLYEHWPYLKIFCWDFIKQPDVLLAMFLHGSRFTREEKLANYAYYEPRCIHESSLSPSIHSIMAAGLGKPDDAIRYFQQATRLDLDDYNRNTCQGLHTTSMAGAYMNIVYGFGGLRSDGDLPSFDPVLPAAWQRLRFRVRVKGSVIEMVVTREAATARLVEGDPVKVVLQGETVVVGAPEAQGERHASSRSSSMRGLPTARPC